MKFTATLTPLATAIALLGLSSPAWSQGSDQRVEITGSNIKRSIDDGALPIKVIRREDLARSGLVTAEQVVASLTSNGNGVDNMASQSDVVSGDSRGNNGASFANLRGQGSRNTLVLVNGRRVAAHGLNGTAVNLNTIPMTAVDRIEVLKDGASAIYGTDAIGGVINFILRKNATGIELTALADVTQHVGGEIYRASATGGIGDLDRDGFNATLSVARTENKALRGGQRDFVNTFQPDRGLAVDTRGTPYATVFAIANVPNILGTATAGILRPGDTQRYNGINPLNLPGGQGCNTMANSAAYDAKLWATPAGALGCAWDTGVSATLQQPVENDSVVARLTKRFGEHEAAIEYIGAKVHSSKSFSEVQLISSATNRYLYPSGAASYDQVFNSIAGVFPVIEANRGLPIAFRWRCIDCGPRQVETDTESGRLFAGIEGPLPWSGWDYKAGVSNAYSSDRSVLGGGYYFRDGMVAAIGSGKVNPFLTPGTQQTAEGTAALEAISAKGVQLYNGRFELTQANASVSGPVFKLPGGEVMVAGGVDVRKETFTFKAASGAPAGGVVIAAAFDASNQLDGKSRDVRAVYAELLVPIVKDLEVTLAARSDDYTGFGRTTNPKLSLRFAPMKSVVLRGSYGEGFRVPTFTQIFNGVTESPYDGKDLVDPSKCPTLVVSTSNSACGIVNPTILTGGNLVLGPETSKQGNLGVVLQPLDNVALSLDYWSIERGNAIRTPSLVELLANYDRYQDRFVRSSEGSLTTIDQRWFNAGGAKASGVDVNLAFGMPLAGAKVNATLDGSYLLTKKSRIKDNDPWGPSELGKFNRYDDPGIRWKHVMTLGYERGPWTGTFIQRYSGSYDDAVLPGVANGTVTPVNWSPKVKAYTTYDASISYKGIKNLTVTAGIKNLLDTDPPFSAYYDAVLGSGSSWDPRVADPRGRSFALRVDYKFF